MDKEKEEKYPVRIKTSEGVKDLEVTIARENGTIKKIGVSGLVDIFGAFPGELVLTTKDGRGHVYSHEGPIQPETIEVAPNKNGYTTHHDLEDVDTFYTTIVDALEISFDKIFAYYKKQINQVHWNSIYNDLLTKEKEAAKDHYQGGRIPKHDMTAIEVRVKDEAREKIKDVLTPSNMREELKKSLMSEEEGSLGQRILKFVKMKHDPEFHIIRGGVLDTEKSFDVDTDGAVVRGYMLALFKYIADKETGGSVTIPAIQSSSIFPEHIIRIHDRIQKYKSHFYSSDYHGLKIRGNVNEVFGRLLTNEDMEQMIQIFERE